MKSGQRGPLSPSRLFDLRSRTTGIAGGRKRKAFAVAREMHTRLVAIGVNVVPADPWAILYATFGIAPNSSINRIASDLDVDRDDLNMVMGRLCSELACHEKHLTAEQFLAAVERAKNS